MKTKSCIAGTPLKGGVDRIRISVFPTHRYVTESHRVFQSFAPHNSSPKRSNTLRHTWLTKLSKSARSESRPYDHWNWIASCLGATDVNVGRPDEEEGRMVELDDEVEGAVITLRIRAVQSNAGGSL
jgi:hypothetical protein